MRIYLLVDAQFVFYECVCLPSIENCQLLRTRHGQAKIGNLQPQLVLSLLEYTSGRIEENAQLYKLDYLDTCPNVVILLANSCLPELWN